MVKKICIIFILLLLLISLIACNKATSTSDNDVNADNKNGTSKDINSEKENDLLGDKDSSIDIANDTTNKDNTGDDNLIPLEKVIKYQLGLININKTINERNIHVNLAESDISGNRVYINEGDNLIRESTKLLLCGGKDDLYNTDVVEHNMKNAYYKSSYNFYSSYNIIYNRPYVEFNGYSDDPSVIKIKSFDFSYVISNISINAFIKRNDDNKTFSCIIDPAYMYNIPLYHNTEDLCRFNINGADIKADTLEFEAVAGRDADMSEFDNIKQDYVYAKINATNFGVHYLINDDEGTYKNNAILTGCTLISEDTNQVLNNSIDLNFTIAEKDPNMKKVYDCLIKYLPDILEEVISGVVILDLDFDTFPELLVSTKNTYIDNNGDIQNCSDVDIYKILDDGIKYIDTIYNYDTTIAGSGNILAIKTLDDGSKAWFNMSYKNRTTDKVEDTDYLFTMKNDKLSFTEIFRTEIMSDKTNYYYLGELMEFETINTYNERYGEVIGVCKWNDYSSIYGTWDLVGKVKQDYCEDMSDNVFNLYSDWIENACQYNGEKVFTSRMLSHELAYLIDSYYLGDYSPERFSYYFQFTGGFAKPVIYLYPERKTDVNVTIDLEGALTCTYPVYKNGWNVMAMPDGTLINKDDGREYSYLYWEGIGETKWDMSKGFVVKGSETIEFLQDKLEYLGLTNKELNEFIVYWLPHMQNNEYNLITFQTDLYEQSAKLNISPEPDSILRIFMVFRGLDKPIDVEEQELPSFERKGFTVIEWGGIEVN